MGKKMPLLFIGHGSPMNIILDNNFTRSLAQWGKSIPRPRAILVVSAHWLTVGTFVTCMEKPRTIHDFYGFPEDLYSMKYPCPGAPAEAKFVTGAVRKAPVACNQDWGLDHASWAVLKHLYPAADIPVFELSLDYSFNDWHPKPVQYHYDLAAELARGATAGSPDHWKRQHRPQSIPHRLPQHGRGALSVGRGVRRTGEGESHQRQSPGSNPVPEYGEKRRARRPDPGPLPPHDIHNRPEGAGRTPHLHP